MRNVLPCAAVYLIACSSYGQSKGIPTLSITEWSVAGDGTTDDTATIQKAINNAIDHGATLLVPPGPGGGCYRSGNLLIHNSTNLTIQGSGGTICFKGRGPDNARIGLQYSGTVTNLTIEGLEISGAGPDAAFHAGIWGYSGAVIKNLTVRNNYIHDVSLGISVNADLGGSIDGFLIEGNRVENVIGSLPGTGYGIHHANGSGMPSNGRIIGNMIVGAQRHSIYEGKGSAVVIANNTIENHAIGRPTPGSAMPAIVISRGTDITVSGNVVDGATDGSLGIDTDNRFITRNITVIGNSFSNPLGLFPMVTIGTVDPAHDGWPESVAFIGNTFYASNTHVLPIQINCGKHLNFVANTITDINASGHAAAVEIRGMQETSGTATYTDDLSFSVNDIQITTAKGIAGNAWDFYRTAATSGIGARFVENSLDIPNEAFRFEVGQTDPNILVSNDSLSGVSLPLLKAGSTSITGHISELVSLDASSPATVPGCSPDVVASIHGVELGDTVRVASSAPMPPNFTLDAFVSAPSAVSIRWCQLAGRPTDPDGHGQQYRVDLWKQ
jgi:hypothetical protein